MNRQGESQPLVAATSVTAKDPFSKPGKTGAPEVVDWDRDHVDLEWAPPKNGKFSRVEPGFLCRLMLFISFLLFFMMCRWW